MAENNAPAYPPVLSEIEDDAGGGDETSSSEGEFGRVQMPSKRGARTQDRAGAGTSVGTTPSRDSAFDPSMMYSVMSAGWGSTYFQAPPVDGNGRPLDGNGQPIPPDQVPPHLAYWMSQSAMHQYGAQWGAPPGSSFDANAPTTPKSPDDAAAPDGSEPSAPHTPFVPPDDEAYEVYGSRWIMLFYMSLLNLLSDWTCYSVAPIALLTQKAFGDVDPESLVTVFLGANAMASAAEPAILGRLGLRRTVVFGAALLMLGSAIKSGGPGIGTIRPDFDENGEDTDDGDIAWRLYLGFFLVGLSQPMYQCTPALLSASWFPENERTMATGVALNSNQLGIGCAFVFGTMLVATEQDIVPYFGLLTAVATITFVGAALQFDDAPPTPPSDTARVIRGDLVIKIPRVTLFGRGIGGATLSGPRGGDDKLAGLGLEAVEEEAAEAAKAAVGAPSPAPTDEPTEKSAKGIRDVEGEVYNSFLAAAPSPASTDAPVGAPEGNDEEAEAPPVHAQPNHPLASPGATSPGGEPPYPHPYPYVPPPGYYPVPPPPGGAPGGPIPRSSAVGPQFFHGYDDQGHYHNALLGHPTPYGSYDDAPFVRDEDEGVEPIMTQLDHHLDIDIRDDQLVQQFKACFRRKGFSHCVVAFTTSGIIVNTLSTFMDYLVTLNGAGREYVGIVGGTFQMLIMCSSLVFGGWTDRSRKYYFVTLAMLIFGAFALSVCNVNLDADAGGDLRVNLLIVGVLAGPLQPISTELGVEVVYPLSENTVLVIQQLFSNLLSAAFIPIFKALRDVGTSRGLDEATANEVPQYTFSFYMLIVIHAVSTCYFATFNGTYLRHEAELEKKAKKEEEKERLMREHAQKRGYGAVEPN